MGLILWISARLLPLHCSVAVTVCFLNWVCRSARLSSRRRSPSPSTRSCGTDLFRGRVLQSGCHGVLLELDRQVGQAELQLTQPLSLHSQLQHSYNQVTRLALVLSSWLSQCAA